MCVSVVCVCVSVCVCVNSIAQKRKVAESSNLIFRLCITMGSDTNLTVKIHQPEVPLYFMFFSVFCDFLENGSNDFL
uniref:Putative secreted protein n=1 Tax=Panstrongylus lignarius TaxID=156445 RepID=A0A224Y3R9_9HEMI